MIKLLEKKYRLYYPKQLKNKKQYSSLLKGLNGIEIGGPSNIFTKKGLLPIYPFINNLDGCNFSDTTVWEGHITDGLSYAYDTNKKGYQYIAEGSSLPMINDAAYDFLLSCHNLEHLANPIKALHEWKRIIRDNGYLLIILPHKDLTFDNKRPVTKLAHIINDFEIGKGEDDDTHFEEIINLHDFSLEKAISSQEELKQRLRENIKNRCAHHHVFNTMLVAEMMNEVQLQIVELDRMYHNIFVLAKKNTNGPINNIPYLSSQNILYSAPSKYPSDFINGK